LTAAFAQAEPALALAAKRAHEADAALSELATLDLATCSDGDGTLQVPAWRALSAARQANALRAWWRLQAGRGAPEALVQRLLAELPGAGGPGDRAARREPATGRWPAGEGQPKAVLYRGRLRCEAGGAVHEVDEPPGERTIDLSQPGCWPVPEWGGAFEVVDASPGLPLDALRQASLRPRRGGEQFQTAPRALPRSLKKQYQAAGIPGPHRTGPLVWCDDRLLHVPGLGDDARSWAPAGAPQRRLRWCPHGR
jgi:tRNA(Ile)-lysidine synthase